MALLKTLQASSKGAAGEKKYNAFGVVFSVETAKQEADGNLKLTGKVLNTNKHVSPDETVTVLFRGDNASKSVTNFVKGNGKKALETPTAAAGTFLTLEGCYPTEDMDGDNRVLSARWLNTLASSRNDDHDNRSFIEDVLATAPRISFKNPDVKPGEPERITLPVNAEKVTVKVKNEHGTFDKEFPAIWAIGKLAGLPATEKPAVTIDTIEPSAAVEVTDRGSLEDALRVQLARGTKALAMLRVSDGEDVLTRAIYVAFKKDGDEYVPDVDKTLEDLFKNNVFKGVPNDDLFAGMANGSVKVEAIPGYRMSYAGDPTKDDNAAYKLVSDVKTNRTQRYEMIFGTDANRFAKVILPGIARNDSIAGFSPFNILADDPGTYLANEFGTAVIQPNAHPAPPVQPSEPSEPAPDFAALEDQFDHAMEQGGDEPSRPRP
ncbi:hypothetical protein [Chromobacterium haemolyticum]|uniref:hypothetical protein n=1 Tax=Chromobacterium haemolyticum TaxID=394935 RepID=UPI00244987D9|nr:hypothetical protein [Chromobacterium haemolyticum]MDH0342031.1 hypothetical protein [Chromobacterium haemolyticum]